MTAEITQCPQCGTRFKVTAEQLDAHDGLVRCGHCHEVFNAGEHLHDNTPSPQLSLPIEPELADAQALPHNEPDLTPILNVPGLEPEEEEPATLAQRVQFVEELTDEVLPPPARMARWPWLVAGTLLALSLLAQATYFYRVEIGARLPGLKPALEQYCTLLHCTVPLPQKIGLLVIESSELEADPGQTNLVTLHALLHNRAAFAQAHPSLELSLTDLQDQVIARRVFRPADYLTHSDDAKNGIPANRDLDIRLRLDTTDLKPSGYRLFLFYPR